jgi:glutamine cyclotransferase
VVQWIDCSDIVAAEGNPHKTRNPEAVLNGIASRGPSEVWLTGKLWEHVYAVDTTPTGA